ncbi:unnamed protein product, partial [marine sediment metagenome]
DQVHGIGRFIKKNDPGIVNEGSNQFTQLPLSE